MVNNDWKIPYGRAEAPRELVESGCAPLLAALLKLRGIDTAAAAREFLDCTAELYDPMLLKDMDLAVSRIRAAADRGETVAVYGDYDVDGITSTCLLTLAFRRLGLSALPYIPDRIEEGYGLNCAAIEALSAQGVTLIVTVDCGITAVEETIFARGLGVDMVITDHHECREKPLPDACAVVDPKRSDCTYPNKNLAGVGVALKLACALLGREAAREFYGLAAIGTVADVMPLIGENRRLVREGLDSLKNSPNLGVEALLRESGSSEKRLTASILSFTLAPRLNAAGRLGHAGVALELLTAKSAEEAERLAGELCRLNRSRQELESEIWDEAAGMLDGVVPERPIVLASESWHQGVIGISASRLAEQYGLPTVMICLSGEHGKGSCRSYGGFNLFEALSACSEYLEGFGGHALAAGLTIRRERISDFTHALAKYYAENIPAAPPAVECELHIDDTRLLDMENVAALESMEPFGSGNSKPVMCLTGVRLCSISKVGNGRHLRLAVRAGREETEGIYFSADEASMNLRPGAAVDVAFTPQINEFRSRRSVQLLVCAMREHEAAPLCELIAAGSEESDYAAARYVPQREDFVAAWRHLTGLNAPLADDLDGILKSTPARLCPETYFICLRVWLELGLLTPGDGGLIYGASPDETVKHVELGRSEYLKKLEILRGERDYGV